MNKNGVNSKQQKNLVRRDFMDYALAGVRILDLSRIHAGPFGSQILGDMGAEVIKVERFPDGDESRVTTKYYDHGVSAFFLPSNRNKKSIVMNLKSKTGRELFYRLVAVSDVVWDNFRPGVLKEMGVDYEIIKKINPGIISCSISGYGSTGPYWNLPSYDILVQALSGTMGLTGNQGEKPVKIGVPIGDLLGGILGAFAVTLALFQREKTGRGQRIDISLLDGQVSMLHYHANYYFASGETPVPQGTGHPNLVPYDVYKTADGYIALAVFGTPKSFWQNTCMVLGLEGYIDDERFNNNDLRVQNREELNRLIQGEFIKKDTMEWTQALWKLGVPAAPVNNVSQVFIDPQVLHRKMLVEVEHPAYGRVKLVGNPIKMEGCLPEEKWSAPPLLGEHTEEVLKELLKIDNKEIERLCDLEVISVNNAKSMPCLKKQNYTPV
jgi:crotonobetainyl-CoA:carnitine CoA-transferase CaiB-like acyl-CoA transferase